MNTHSNSKWAKTRPVTDQEAFSCISVRLVRHKWALEAFPGKKRAPQGWRRYHRVCSVASCRRWGYFLCACGVFPICAVFSQGKSILNPQRETSGCSDFGQPALSFLGRRFCMEKSVFQEVGFPSKTTCPVISCHQTVLKSALLATQEQISANGIEFKKRN